MPKFGEKLSSADIDGLVDQIQAMNKKKSAALRPRRPPRINLADCDINP
jgi:hypothetical protein